MHAVYVIDYKLEFLNYSVLPLLRIASAAERAGGNTAIVATAVVSI